MADSTRDRMIDSAVKRLATSGFQGASFSSIVEDAGAPRGSIYHHFPGGKDEVVRAAIDRFRDRAAAILTAVAGGAADDVVTGFVGLWRGILTHSDLRAGCALLGATVTADDDDLVALAGAAFGEWESQLAAILRRAGVADAAADDLASTLLAACEGAVVLCRAQHSFGPLDRVERQLRLLAGAAGAG